MTQQTPQEDPAPLEPVGPAHQGITVGFVPGVMPGTWFSRWDARHGHEVPLHRVALDGDDALAALVAGHLHLALLRPEREPAALDRDRFHAVELYREKRLVVLPRDHVLTLLDEVPLEELAEEFLLQDPEEVPEWAEASREHRESDPRRLPAMRHLGDAVELVAAGLGLLVVPMSLARLHRRKDVTHRVVPDLPETPVLLVWPRLGPGERPAQDEAVIQDFVGITRGRRAGSSRGEAAGAASDGRRPARAVPERRKASPAASEKPRKGRPAAGGNRSGKARSAKSRPSSPGRSAGRRRG